MKLKKLISNFYTSLTAICFFLCMATIFLVVTFNLDKRFHTYLLEKAYFVSEQFIQDSSSKRELDYAAIMKRFSSVFPETEDIVTDYKSLLKNNVLSSYLSDNQVKRLVKVKYIHTRHKEKYASALYVPNGSDPKVVLITAHNDYGANAHNMFIKIMIISFIASVVVIYFAGGILATRIMNPFRSVLRQIRRIRSTNLNERIISDHSSDEIDELVSTLNNMLSQLNIAFDSQKNFISHASHELNNPMTAILGECDITLSKHRSDEEYRAALYRISTETERLDSLIKDLFVLAKSDMEIMNYQLDTYKAKEFITTICEEMKKKKPSFQFNIICNCDSSIMVNNQLFAVAIGNIIDNAFKYSNGQMVHITLADTTDHSCLTISVRDNGIGIPKEELKNIFQSFYRANNSRSFRGQGIGLSLSQNIIKSYNGTIDVHSTVGKGTEFIVTIPTCLA